jgi:hypothetical protein
MDTASYSSGPCTLPPSPPVGGDSRTASTNTAIRSRRERVDDFQYDRAAASTPNGIAASARTPGSESVLSSYDLSQIS